MTAHGRSRTDTLATSPKTHHSDEGAAAHRRYFIVSGALRNPQARAYRKLHHVQD